MSRLKVAHCAVTMSILLGTAPGIPVFADKGPPDARAQLGFGVDMAKRGLWSEALFRFEQAKLLSPENVSVLNNLAICYEAGGRFEEALATYREALRLAPENKAVKQNYSRFAEFYQGFRPRKPATANSPAPVAPPADPGQAPAETPPQEAPPPPPPPPTGSTPALSADFGGAR